MAKTKSEIDRERKRKRKSQGLCIECSKPMDREGVLCIACNDRRNKEGREAYRCYQENGVCPKCRTNALFGDEKTCLECRVKACESMERVRNGKGRELANKEHSEYARAKYKERSELGICTRCGKKKPDEGYKTCRACRTKLRNYKKVEYVDRSHRFDDGLCYNCGKALKEGYRVCEECYRKNLNNLDNEKTKEQRREYSRKIYKHVRAKKGEGLCGQDSKDLVSQNLTF